MKKPVCIVFHALTYRDRVYGNPYSSCTATLVYRDGTIKEHKTVRGYGQPIQAIYRALGELFNEKLIPKRIDSESIHGYFSRCKIARLEYVSEVSRMKDL